MSSPDTRRALLALLMEADAESPDLLAGKIDALYELELDARVQELAGERAEGMYRAAQVTHLKPGEHPPAGPGGPNDQ